MESGSAFGFRLAHSHKAGMASGNKASKLAFGFRVLKVLGFWEKGFWVWGLGV